MNNFSRNKLRAVNKERVNINRQQMRFLSARRQINLARALRHAFLYMLYAIGKGLFRTQKCFQRVRQHVVVMGVAQHPPGRTLRSHKDEEELLVVMRRGIITHLSPHMQHNPTVRGEILKGQMFLVRKSETRRRALVLMPFSTPGTS